MDWVRAPADTPVCKDVLLKDVVQLILDGVETPEAVMAEFGLAPEDSGAEQISEILAVFVPVVNAWQSGAGCGGGCAGCAGGCGGVE